MSLAIYVRVSTQRQAQTQSIDQQIERLQTHCLKQQVPWSEVEIFRDDGYSGSTLKRPGLDRLRDRVAQGCIDRLLITAPDRLARKYVHQVLLIEELERNGCQVEFVEHPMSQDPHDQLLLQIRGAVAEYERTLIAERMRRGRLQKLQSGTLLPWTKVPYGYRTNPDRPRDPGGVRVEAAEAAVVAGLFTAYLEEGHSLCGLTRALTERGISSPSGRARWSQATVHGILTNPAYTGLVYAGRTRAFAAQRRRSPLEPLGRKCGHRDTPPTDWLLVAQVPPLVSQDQFEGVQAKLSQNQKFATRHNTAHVYLLRALVSCGVCRLACTGRTRGKYGYYGCRGKSTAVQSCRDEKCPARFIPAQQLDDVVWQDVCELLTHPDRIAEALQRAQGGAWLPQELQARRENLRKAVKSLRQQVERLTEAYLAGVLELEEYRRRRQELAQRQETFESQTHQLEASVHRQGELMGLVRSVQEFCQRVQCGLANASFEQKRQLIELLIDRVVVTNGEVEIRYVIPTSPKSEQVRFCHLRSDYFDPHPQAIQPDNLLQGRR